MNKDGTSTTTLPPIEPISLEHLKPIEREFPYPDSFGSGTENHSGLGLSFLHDKENERVVAVTTPDERFAAYNRLLHGGIAMTMLDEAMGWSVYAAKGIVGVTLEVNSKFEATGKFKYKSRKRLEFNFNRNAEEEGQEANEVNIQEGQMDAPAKPERNAPKSKV